MSQENGTSLKIYLSDVNYDAGHGIIYNAEVLQSNLYDYNYAEILVKGNVSFTAAPGTRVAYKNCTPFTKCITKVDETMYNLIEYSSNYSKTKGSLWFSPKDEETDFNTNITNDIKVFK